MSLFKSVDDTLANTTVTQIGCAAIELAFCLIVFWDSTAAALQDATSNGDEPTGGLRQALFTKRSARVTWICAFFLLGYVGIEVALGGWIVTFMMRVRHGEDFASGMVATGFWLGIACGRVVLGFITPRIGEKLAIIVSIRMFYSLSPILSVFFTFALVLYQLTYQLRQDILIIRNSMRLNSLARA